MVISRSPAASQAVSGQLRFGGKSLPLQEHIKILRVAMDRYLRFYIHVSVIARQTSHRVHDQRIVAGNLNSRGIFILYKAHIRLWKEYGKIEIYGMSQSWRTVP